MLFQETVRGNCLICKVCHLNDPHAQNTADVCSTLTRGGKSMHSPITLMEEESSNVKGYSFKSLSRFCEILILLILSVIKTKNFQILICIYMTKSVSKFFPD